MVPSGMAIASLVLATSPAFGCGHCIEDKVAAVYDHGVITRAVAQGHQMAFFAIEGGLSAGRESRHAIDMAITSVKGIDARSSRVSVESASLSLSYDGRRTSPIQIMNNLNRNLGARGLRVYRLTLPQEAAELKALDFN